MAVESAKCLSRFPPQQCTDCFMVVQWNKCGNEMIPDTQVLLQVILLTDGVLASYLAFLYLFVHLQNGVVCFKGDIYIHLRNKDQLHQIVIISPLLYGFLLGKITHVRSHGIMWEGNKRDPSLYFLSQRRDYNCISSQNQYKILDVSRSRSYS